ncbi:MAG: hypothetical protein U5L72_14060 [Bacteroidales bacterium]|nr:hypothetical protein [Bacteroidales bacterium]
MFIAMQYFGMAMAGEPYCGRRRAQPGNTGKDFFFNRGSSGPHPARAIMSGDDDLFVNRNATSDNCSLMLSHDSFTLSSAQKNTGAWIKQKRRHLSTAAMI